MKLILKDVNCVDYTMEIEAADKNNTYLTVDTEDATSTVLLTPPQIAALRDFCIKRLGQVAEPTDIIVWEE